MPAIYVKSLVRVSATLWAPWAARAHARGGASAKDGVRETGTDAAEILGYQAARRPTRAFGTARQQGRHLRARDGWVERSVLLE